MNVSSLWVVVSYRVRAPPAAQVSKWCQCVLDHNTHGALLLWRWWSCCLLGVIDHIYMHINIAVAEFILVTITSGEENMKYLTKWWLFKYRIELVVTLIKILFHDLLIKPCPCSKMVVRFAHSCVWSHVRKKWLLNSSCSRRRHNFPTVIWFPPAPLWSDSQIHVGLPAIKDLHAALRQR